MLSDWETELALGRSKTKVDNEFVALLQKASEEGMDISGLAP